MIEREISEGLENLLRYESVVGEVQPPSEVKPIWERIAQVRGDSSISIIPQTSIQFENALTLYTQRPDQE